MSKAADRDEKVALELGYHDGHRVRRGETFWSTKGHKGHWFKSTSSKDKDVVAALSGEPGILARNTKDVIKVLPTLSRKELNTLKQDEANGQKRKGLIAKIDDEIANRVGQTQEELTARANDAVDDLDDKRDAGGLVDAAGLME